MWQSKDLAAVSDKPEADAPGLHRRKLLTVGAGAAALGAVGLVSGCTESSDSGPKAAGASAGQASGGAARSGTSLLQTIQKTKKLSIGVNLGTVPLQYKDEKTGEPTGYVMELTKLMAKDLDVELELVEQPFAELFAGLAAGRFQMSGIAATILPSRASKVLFASDPLLVESEVVLLKPGKKISDLSQLNTPNTTIAVRLGSSQSLAGRQLLPKAKFKELNEITAVAEDVASGRSDACIVSEFAAIGPLDKHPDLTAFEGPPVFVDYNTYFMPYNDFELKAWVDNWISYQISHNVLANMWEQWVAPGARKHNLKTTPVTSSFVK